MPTFFVAVAFFISSDGRTKQIRPKWLALAADIVFGVALNHKKAFYDAIVGSTFAHRIPSSQEKNDISAEISFFFMGRSDLSVFRTLNFAAEMLSNLILHLPHIIWNIFSVEQMFTLDHNLIKYLEKKHYGRIINVIFDAYLSIFVRPKKNLS